MQYHFQKPSFFFSFVFTACLIVSNSTTVQALVGIGAIQLYRSDIKQVTEMSEINAGMIKTFANTSRYYIKKENELKLIKLNKEEIMPFLMDKEAAVNAVIETKRLNLKKESDIIQVIQAYNNLP